MLFDVLFRRFKVFSLGRAETVHCIYVFSPPPNPGQNPGQKSGQKPGQKTGQKSGQKSWVGLITRGEG